MWVLTVLGAASGIHPGTSRLFLASPALRVLCFSFSAALGNRFLCPPAPLLRFNLLTTHFHVLFILPRVLLLSHCVSAACKLGYVLYRNPDLPA